MATRQSAWERLKSKPDVSVLIVGAGVNGIGTFRDLALQGVDVVIVDQNDFCSGASAASSHMLHGGIRYLENGEFRLVREALTERNRMLHNAPHYAKPLPTTIPIFKWFSGLFNAPLRFLNWRDKPSERGAIVIKLGLMMYDWFTRGQQGLPTHRLISRSDSLGLRPQINPDIVFTAQYYDAWMPYPERICLEMVMDAEAANPNALALNYVGVEGVDGGAVRLRDGVTGEQLHVKPRLVINAAGPWIDLANNTLGKPTKFIGGTKGSHLLVDHPALHAMLLGHEMFFENKDGRITLFFPLQDKVIIGTTDIRVDTPDVVCTEEEVDYMLELVSYVFPTVKVERSQIVFRFCGVRPLPSSEASTAGQISRDHSIREVRPDAQRPFPVYSLVSGKWTTFRAFSEQAADKALEFLKLPRKVSTEKLAIGGGRAYPPDEAAQAAWLSALQGNTGLSSERVKTLFERYGTYAAQVADFCAAGADEPLRHHATYSRREIEFLVEREKIVHLDDLILRRSLMAMLGEVQGGLLGELTALLGGERGWSDEQQRAELDRTVQILHKRHGVALERLMLTAGVGG